LAFPGRRPRNHYPSLRFVVLLRRHLSRGRKRKKRGGGKKKRGEKALAPPTRINAPLPSSHSILPLLLSSLPSLSLEKKKKKKGGNRREGSTADSTTSPLSGSMPSVFDAEGKKKEKRKEKRKRYKGKRDRVLRPSEQNTPLALSRRTSSGYGQGKKKKRGREKDKKAPYEAARCRFAVSTIASLLSS